MSEFKVQVGEFEGPIDLLLQLIEKRKLHPSEVAMAAVADSYLEYVNKLEQMPVGDTAHFVYVAATLLLIKSKSLLPTLSLSEEEQADIKDLEKRLKIYQLLKKQSKVVEENFGKNIIHPASESKSMEVSFHPPEDLTLPTVLQTLRDIFARVPKITEVPEKIVRKVLSLEEVIDDLGKRVSRGLSMSFKEFAGKHEEKTNVVVSFLAMLELVKQGLINVTQDDRFNDIEMSSLDPKLPEYS